MESHRSYDRIIQQPLAKLRQQVATSFRRGTLEQDFDALTKQISDYVAKTNPDEALSFTGEVAKARASVASWQVIDEPEQVLEAVLAFYEDRDDGEHPPSKSDEDRMFYL